LIFSHGREMLAIEVDGHAGIARQLQGLACCQVHQWGEVGREATFLFNVADFEAVAALVLPHRKRQFTTAQRAEAADRLKRWQFPAVITRTKNDPNTGVKSPA